MDNSLRKWRITHYSNKIWLYDTTDQTFIKSSGDVVLSFPYKDCVLEWGMSDEESGREEKFFHETLDRADIDTLRDPKVLTKFEKIDKDGIHKIEDPDEIDFWDETGELRENLLIKWNNLIALYSLRQRLAGKVKLIYIDPPYNTGSDGFRYNDNFNHSTWLVFMRNRLEAARELLRDDGVIFVQCDDNEQAYLKVLMDEVFGRNSFITNFLWQRTKTPPRLSSNVARVHDFILLYAKKKEEFWLYKIPLKQEYIEKTYKNPDNDPRWRWRLVPLLQPNNSTNKVQTFTLPDWRNITWKWRCSRETFNQYVSDNLLVYSESGSPNRKLFLSEIDWQIPTTWISDLVTNESGTKEIEWLFDDESFTAPKPEELIRFLVSITTQPWDIVLDYHLWSGTTAAVAHKMGRRWIGIEQMDYIEDIAKVRLQKVIEWEQWGISNQNWRSASSLHGPRRNFTEYMSRWRAMHSSSSGSIDETGSGMRAISDFLSRSKKQNLENSSISISSISMSEICMIVGIRSRVPKQH